MDRWNVHTKINIMESIRTVSSRIHLNSKSSVSENEKIEYIKESINGVFFDYLPAIINIYSTSLNKEDQEVRIVKLSEQSGIHLHILKSAFSKR